MNTAQNWLTLFAIIVALFGPYVYDYFKNRKLENRLSQVLKKVIEDFIFDLERILNERNPVAKNDNDQIIFNETSRSEMAGYIKIFEALILNNYQQSKNSQLRVIFFSHFQKNMNTVFERTSENKDGYLTMSTVKKLLVHAEDTKKGKS